MKRNPKPNFLKICFLFVLALATYLPILNLYADNQQEYDKLQYQYNNYIIMPETLVYKIQKNSNDYVLYDLRNSEDYSKYHVIGAKNLPWEKIKNSLENSYFPRNKEIILISSDGFYSLKAVELLLNSGYETVYSIEGGMENWPYKKLLVK